MSIASGYSSYAANLEQRIITNTWWTSHRTKGRFIFRRIYEDANNTNWQGTCIGMEMVTRTLWEPWGRQRRDAGEYIFKFYHDGIALYRKAWLRNMVQHYDCVHDIDRVVNHYFYVDREITTNVHESSYQNDQETIIVMRRKPVSSLARSLFANGQNLGDFLVSKYNRTHEEVIANA